MTDQVNSEEGTPMARVVDTITTVTSQVRDAADQARAAVDDARRPGEPLDALSEYAKKSPLTALGLAFMFGFAFARRW